MTSWTIGALACLAFVVGCVAAVVYTEIRNDFRARRWEYEVFGPRAEFGPLPDPLGVGDEFRAYLDSATPIADETALTRARLRDHFADAYGPGLVAEAEAFLANGGE